MSAEPIGMKRISSSGFPSGVGSGGTLGSNKTKHVGTPGEGPLSCLRSRSGEKAESRKDSKEQQNIEAYEKLQEFLQEFFKFLLQSYKYSSHLISTH